MDIERLRNVIYAQKFSDPALNERYIQGCSQFGAQFDANLDLFTRYTRSFFPGFADVIIDLYKAP